MGQGFARFLGGSLVSGIELLLEVVNFDQMLQSCDLVITGEGKLDQQSFDGKVIAGVVRHARKFHVPVVAVAGYVEPDVRRALDAFLADPYNDSFELPDDVIEELNRTSHRHYSPGFYFGKEQAQQTPSHTYVRDWDFIGTVDSWENGVAHCTQRGKFAVGDSIEILQPDGSVVKLTPAWIGNADGERVDAPRTR